MSKPAGPAPRRPRAARLIPQRGLGKSPAFEVCDCEITAACERPSAGAARHSVGPWPSPASSNCNQNCNHSGTDVAGLRAGPLTARSGRDRHRPRRRRDERAVWPHINDQQLHLAKISSRRRRGHVPISIVEQYWGGVARRLQAEVDVFNRLIGHAGEQGRENETALITLLENLPPSRVGVRTGIVIDSSSRRSRQSDVVLFDPTLQPTVMAQVNQMIFPVEVVSAVVEVKTTLTAADLEEFSTKKGALRALQANNSALPPAFCLFAYHAWASPQTVGQHIMTMAPDDRPDVFCIVPPGIVGWKSLLPDGEYQLGFVPLHERGTATGSGDQKSGGPSRRFPRAAHKSWTVSHTLQRASSVRDM